MSFVELAPRVLQGTPPWVWVVLALLVFLGVRRLKARRVHLAVAAIAPVAFTVWSLTGVMAASRIGTPLAVIGVWTAAFAAGALTAFVHRTPRPMHLGGGVFLFPASVVPLLLYLSVFAVRYGLGVAAALRPEAAFPLGLAAVAVSSATAGRFTADILPRIREALAARTA